MKASITDLHSHTADILSALDRNETVTLLYQGEVKGTLTPANSQQRKAVADHAFFGMSADKEKTPLEELDALRAPRHDF